MELRQTFAEACENFPQFRSLIAQAQQDAPDEATRTYLGKLLSNMDQAFAEAQQVVPQALGEIESRMSDVRSAADKTTKQNAATKGAIQAAQGKLAEVGKPPAKPAPEMSPELGKTLHAELLARFSDKPPEQAPDPDTYGDFWEHWQEGEQE